MTTTQEPGPAHRANDAALTVVLVIAEPLLRSGLRLLVEQAPDIQVIGEAESIAGIPETPSDVYVCDMCFGDVEEASRLVRSLHPGAVLGLVGDADGQEVVRILAAGVTGVIAKRDPNVGLVAGVRAAAQNLSVLSERPLQAVLEQVDPVVPAPAAVPEQAARGIAELTPREREVFMSVAAGHSNAKIAERLVLAEATVKSHVGQVLAKLGVAHRSQVVMIAYETGAVRPGDGATA